MANNRYKLTFILHDCTKKTVEFEVPQGDPGRGIVSVTRTAGTGEPGTVDTYTIMFTDNTTSTFTIYNGADGKDGNNADLTGYATEKWVEEKLTEHTGGNAENGIPIGGKTGQFLCKKSDEDYDVKWANFEIPKEYGLITYDQDKTITIT